MVFYTVVPPERLWAEEEHTAGEPAVTEVFEVFLGRPGGVPAWAWVRQTPAGLRLVRLWATDPELYLHPGLAPDSPVAFG